MTEVVFEVAADGTPELEEEYTLSLTAVNTVSDDISQMGFAVFDTDATVATITLKASDHPHGVIEFQDMSVLAESEESSPVTLIVVREFGSIGEFVEICAHKAVEHIILLHTDCRSDFYNVHIHLLYMIHRCS